MYFPQNIKKKLHNIPREKHILHIGKTDFLRYEEGLNVSVDDFLNINLDEIRDFGADDMSVSENNGDVLDMDFSDF